MCNVSARRNGRMLRQCLATSIVYIDTWIVSCRNRAVAVPAGVVDPAS